jgi:hypothetical protein
MSRECADLIEGADFRYAVLEGKSRDAVYVRVLRTLESDLETAGRHRKARWEDGWTQNLREFTASGYDLQSLVPKFVKQNEVVRLEGSYILPADPEFETHFVDVLRTWLFKTFCVEAGHIYEFGCGPAHNLVALANLFPGKQLVGLDWSGASQKLIAKIVEVHQFRISGRPFDMFSPDVSCEIPQNSAVFTIGAMEQLGREFESFLQFLLQKKPAVCINVETLYELYDQADLFDYVAAAYLRKRGYLQGFLPRLRELEREGIVEILKVQRTFGSLYHDGYSFVVWRPRGL